jgi:hypothetical protein
MRDMKFSRRGLLGDNTAGHRRCGGQFYPRLHSFTSHITTRYHNQENHDMVQVKVKLSLCFIFKWTPHHEGVLGSGGINPSILYLGTRWRWVVSFTPPPLRERAPDTHCIGGWEGPRAGMDAVVKRNIPSPYRKSSPPIIQLIVCPRIDANSLDTIIL